jgi:hypothetical protein
MVKKFQSALNALAEISEVTRSFKRDAQGVEFTFKRQPIYTRFHVKTFDLLDKIHVYRK